METSKEIVLVTGASGFIAKHCILELLRAGFRVRGTVRRLGKASQVRATLERHVPLGDRLELVEADLASDAGWVEAVAGCRYVLHTASPFPPELPKHEDELIVPARDGALRVLRASAAAGVERVVMTSSIAAVIYGHPKGEAAVYDENTWSVLNADVGAYEKSKTIAERAAWEFVRALPAEHPLELVTVNPGVVLGPVLDADAATSAEVVGKLLRREVPGCVRVGWPMVDVRDVARMHLLALTSQEAAGQRFICAGEFAWLGDVASVLERHFGPRGYKVPVRALPGWTLRISALFDRTLKLLVHELDLRREVSHERAQRVLGWKPRGLEEMVVAMGESLIEHGVVPAAKRRHPAQDVPAAA